MLETTISLLLGLGCVFGQCTPEMAVASRYGEGVTVATLDARIDMNHLSMSDVALADGYVAVLDCSRIGEWMVMRSNSGDWEAFLIFDCASRTDTHTQQFMEHIIAEVDYYTAERWEFKCLCGWEVEVLHLNDTPFLTKEDVLALFAIPMYTPA